MTTATRQLPPHGSLSRHKHHGCKCDTCYDSYNAYQSERAKLRAAGLGRQLVHAAPVRRHLIALYAAGLPPHRIATLARLDINTIKAFTHPSQSRPQGRRQRTSADTAARILAVSPDAMPGLVDCTGTRRRVQALVAIGWPCERIARAAGISPQNLAHLLGNQRVRHSTAAAVRAAYEEMSVQKPERCGVSRATVKRSKRRADANRWAPPSYWAQYDAIDDPDFQPEYGRLRAEVIAEDAAWIMATSGLDAEQAAERLGITRAYLHQAIARAKEAA